MVPAKTAVLAGPTASGKSDLALEFCSGARQEIEIVSADSLCVYRLMDIGTAKPTPEQRAKVTHHLIDICDPSEAYTAGDFVLHAQAALLDIASRNKRALIVGGTGFYLKALLHGMWPGAMRSTPTTRAELEQISNEDLFTRLEAQDPESAYRIGKADHYRLVRALELISETGTTPSELRSRELSPSPDFELMVIDREPAELESKIRARTQSMLSRGWIAEVERLFQTFPTSRALCAVGYRQIVDFLQRRAPQGRKLAPGLKGLEDEIALATRQLVKQQRTWFRGQHEAPWFVLDRDRSALLERLNTIYET